MASAWNFQAQAGLQGRTRGSIELYDILFLVIMKSLKVMGMINTRFLCFLNLF